MLDELRLRGLGVIDDALLPLGPGLTVVTGETGAGKTMVVTGLLLLFGGRADSSLVRADAETAIVDGRIRVAPDSRVAARVRDAGGELDDDTDLVLRRTVSSAGRSRAHVGGAPSPVSVLTELADELVVVHGQSDQLRLVRPGEQRGALDRFAGIDLAAYHRAHADWRTAAAAYDERIGRIAELRREADLLQFGLREIEAADPQPGEDDELAVLAARLASADALRLAAGAAHDALLGRADDPSADAGDVSVLIGTAHRSLTQQSGADPELDALTARLGELGALAADLGAEFGAYVEGLDADPARLEQVEQRRAVLGALVRKYADGPQHNLAEVLDWAKAAADRLAEIDVSDEAIAALAARRAAAADTLDAAAAELTEQRAAAAARLAEAVTAELTGLAMPSARFAVAVTPRAGGPGPDGADEVEFLLQPHPDVAALPIARGASGGELSRLMLALEVCLAGTDPVPTMIFDEIDAGVGGRAAGEVGRRLARLSRAHQVVVVTHLAQVAAYADRHIVVDKHGAGDTGGVTASDVRQVDGASRVAELARMLAGSDSATAREHAAELLRHAAEYARDDPAPAHRRASRSPVKDVPKAARKTAR